MTDNAQGTSLVAIPQRTSLVAQAVDILRRDLEQGVWRDYLPGEHMLCQRLQVSRPTLRAALEWLQREGWIEVSQGRRRRITSPRKSKAPVTESRVIGILVAMPYHMLSSFSLFLISELQRHLTDAGYRVEVHAHPGFSAYPLEKGLKLLLNDVRADCWVVFGNAHGARRWLKQQPERILNLGTYSPEERIPSVCIDLEGTARHAAGMFLRRGHSRIALLVAREPTNDSKLIEKGFVRGIQDFASHSGIGHSIIRHNGTVAGIRSSLDSLLHSKVRPTGMLVVRPQHLLTVMGHLAHSEIQIPRDLSLIGMGHDPSIDHVVPSVAHYQVDWNAYYQRLLRQVLQLAKSGKVVKRKVSIVCEFHDGGTLAPRALT